MTGLMNKVLSFTGYKSQFQAKPVAEPEVLAETPLPMVGLFSLLSDEQKVIYRRPQRRRGLRSRGIPSQTRMMWHVEQLLVTRL